MKKTILFLILILSMILCVSSVTAGSIIVSDPPNSTSDDGTWTDIGNAYDGVFNTYANCAGECDVYLNYTNNYLENSTSVNWYVRHVALVDDAIYTITSPCITQNFLQLWVFLNATEGNIYGYCYNGTDWESVFSSATMGDWENSHSGYANRTLLWNFTGCSVDTDCGSCEWCNAGVCENQTYTDNKTDCGLCSYCDGSGSCTPEAYGEDVKDECDLGCNDDWTIRESFCGNLTENCRQFYVSDGNVCVGGADEDPDAEHNCGTWGDCVDGNTFADEYYVGYDFNGGGFCVDTDWKSSGTFWNVTEGYEINVTEHADTCSEEEIPEAPPVGGEYSANYTASDLPYVATDLLGETGVQLKAQMPLAILILATGVGVGAYYGIKRLWR